MSGTSGAMRCETEVRRQQVRMTRLLPKLSEHRPITNIPSPYPADPAACGNREYVISFFAVVRDT